MESQTPINNPLNMEKLPVTYTLIILYPSNPDWSFAEDADMLSSAYNAIQQSEGWSLLRNFKGESFMFSQDPKIIDLMTKINNAYDCGHSGSSMGDTIRDMQYIANNGFDAYVHLRRSQS
jgi:hypothetical protein